MNWLPAPSRSHRILPTLGFFILVSWVLSVEPAHALDELEPIKTCPLVRAAKPAPAPSSLCADGHCVDLGRGKSICKCLGHTEPARLLYVEDGNILLHWPAEAFLAETDDFHVLSGDIRGDGRSLWVVANRQLTSQGIGVHFWKVYVVSPDQPKRTPISWSASDYGPGSFAIPNDRLRRGCDILVTEWIEGHEPRRGKGLYFVGAWFRLGTDRLTPSTGRKQRLRRYVHSFERERSADLIDYNDDLSPNFEGSPAKWLRPGKAQSYRPGIKLQRLPHN